MGKIFVEVFREQVPIAVRLEDITKHVKRAREINCDEMRIIVSYDPANPGIELIFGRLEIQNKLENQLHFVDKGLFRQLIIKPKSSLVMKREESLVSKSFRYNGKTNNT